MISCQITSNPYADPNAIELTDDDFLNGSLQRKSYLRPGKLFTAHESLITGQAGSLRPATLDKVRQTVAHLLWDDPGMPRSSIP